MIILGTALAVLALVVLAFVAFGGSGDDRITLSAFGVDVTTTPFVIFLAGAAVLLVLEVALWMIRWGVVRHSRTRAEIHRLRRIEAEVEARQVAALRADDRPRGAAPTEDLEGRQRRDRGTPVEPVPDTTVLPPPPPAGESPPSPASAPARPFGRSTEDDPPVRDSDPGTGLPDGVQREPRTAVSSSPPAPGSATTGRTATDGGSTRSGSDSGSTSEGRVEGDPPRP